MLQQAFLAIPAFSAPLGVGGAVFLFLICAIGEVSIALPYVIETVWLLVGFQLGSGQISPAHALALWAAAVLGRETGCTILYYGVRGGAGLVPGALKKRFGSRAAGVARWASVSSPFSIAAGRLVALRFPLTTLAAAQGKLRSLMVGVLLSSIIFDGLFLLVGLAVGTTTPLSTTQMLVASLAGLTGLYVLAIAFRIAWRRLRRPPPR